MRVTIKYLAQLRHAAGIAAEDIDIESPCTLPRLLTTLAQRAESALGRFLLHARSGVQPAILVFHGDTLIRSDSELILKEGDTITLLPPMAGGGNQRSP